MVGYWNSLALPKNFVQITTNRAVTIIIRPSIFHATSKAMQSTFDIGTPQHLCDAAAGK